MRVGILGGGQLGWMTILEGRKLGFEFFVLDKDPKAPACKVADACFTPEQVETFLKSCDVITYEFEHIERELVEKVSHLLSPSAEALELKSSRTQEKSFYRKMGYPTAEFISAKGEELYKRLAEFGLPAVVKAEKLGYDGKGQYLVKSLLQIDDILKNHPKDENFLVERFVNFLFEFSPIGVRNKRGDIKVYPMTINHHEKGILLYNYTSDMYIKEAHNILMSLMEDLNIVGLLAIEFFFCQNGKVLINETAPRPHNTGHYTLDGCYTSQFENLLRAIVNLPLGSAKLKLPSGMVNLLGVAMQDIDIEGLLSIQGVKLYWYGKEKRERRKVGHVNIVANTQKEVEETIKSVLYLIYQTQRV